MKSMVVWDIGRYVVAKGLITERLKLPDNIVKLQHHIYTAQEVLYNMDPRIEMKVKGVFQ